MKLNKIYNGDCLDVMKTFPDNSIDTIITDPPYGLSFMGKKWDYDVPKVELWQEALRVLKPGGTALIFAGSRTQHRMACAVEDAGFILKDCIMWLYGSGFPKATDISKQLDKGHKRKVIGRNPNSRENCDKSNTLYESGTVGKTDEITEPATPEAKLWNGWKSHGLKPAYEPIIVAMKPNDGTYANNALKHGVAGLNIDGGKIGTEKIEIIGGGGGKGTGWGKKNKINEQRTGRFPANIILNEEAAKMLDEQSGESKSSNNSFKATDYKEKDTATPFTRGNFQGKGDKGGASRFFYVAKASKSERNMGTNNYLIINICVENMEQGELQKKDILELTEKWLIELFGKKKMEQFQMDISSTIKMETNKTIISIILNSNNHSNIKEYIVDVLKTKIKSGGNLVENVENINELKQIIINELTEYLLGVKVVVSETQLKISVNENNFHSTVKPLKLMEYLCILTKTPTGGIVLDPFAGSGTTCMACKRTGRPFIGIEQDKEYCKIAEARIEATIVDNKLF